jgi:hypothetical protein
MDWSSFVPTLVANALAVIFGVPFAFWVNGRTSRAAESRRRADDEQLLAQSLKALLNSIENSKNVLRSLETIIAQREPLLDYFLETDTWQTLRPAIAALMKDPATVRELSAYFSDLEVVSRIITRFVEYTSGPLKAGDTTPSQREFLVPRLEQLAQDSERIIGKLIMVIDAIPQKPLPAQIQSPKKQ